MRPSKYKNPLIPAEIILENIHVLRARRVMLDSDLAALYNVETKYLTRQVRRNIKRFPADFMFRLTPQEFLRCQNVTSKQGGRRYRAYAFTEQGVAMLSSILNSDRAIQVNIQIMRTFSKIREMMQHHKELWRKIEAMESKYDSQFKVVFDALRKLLAPPQKPKRQIGFHP